MMAGKLIYVDMDDVLCETAANLCRLAEKEFGRHVDYEDVFAFDLQKVFGLDNEEMRRFMAASHAPGALLTHPVTPGAPEALRALRDAGHSIEIVTGRPAYAHGDTERWLEAAGIGDFPVIYVDKYGRDKCRLARRTPFEKVRRRDRRLPADPCVSCELEGHAHPGVFATVERRVPAFRQHDARGRLAVDTRRAALNQGVRG